jgi:UDP-2,4-diacetamido-2,4,6-trideoxy-beta-L-altropyranose hydrolase
MTQARLCAIRADASPEIGGGHVVRCLTLAGALADAGWHCAFAVGDATVNSVPGIAQVRIIRLAEPANAAALQAALPDGVDLLVTDSYAIDARYEAACRLWARRILAIDDLANRAHDCDLLLDQTLARADSAYRPLVPATARLLLGSEYALLRPEFSALRDTAIASRGARTPSRILISAGLTDPTGASIALIKGTRAVASTIAIDVLIGSQCPNLVAIRDAAAHANAELHVDARDVAGLMAKADLSLGAPGSTAWERCCLGLPSALVLLADNQRDNARALEAAGAATILGTRAELSPGLVARHLEDLLANPTRLAEMARHAAAVCDGDGARRVVAALEAA